MSIKRKRISESPEAPTTSALTPSSSIPSKRPRIQPSASKPTQDRPPATFSPNIGLKTPPASVVVKHKPSVVGGTTRAIPALYTALKLEMGVQFAHVRRFLNSHKGACVLHALLGRPQAYPHTSLAKCDLAHRIGDSEYYAFRSDFRSTNNVARCYSCGSPKIEGVHHQGSWDGPSTACEDDDLQDWVVGLAFHTWRFVRLRERVLSLLGLPPNAFGGGPEGCTRFAKWLGLKNGRDISAFASNLLDFLTIISLNTEDLFGKFEPTQEV